MVHAMISTLVGVGTLVGSLLLDAAVLQAASSLPPTYPPVDLALVEGTPFRPAHDQLCYKTANAVHQLCALILDPCAVGDITNAIQETLPTTRQVFPNGTVVYGVEGVGSIASCWAASINCIFGPTSATFQYQPLNFTTVMAYGLITFTLEDYEHGTTRVTESVQTELFRQHLQMLRGWAQVYEQLAYT
jgi:hypothetical protein